MKLKQKTTHFRFTFIIFLLSGAALACGPIDVARDILASASTVTPSARSATGTAFIWYVAPDGDDGATCSYRDEPCRTIQGAVDKATDHDTIEVAAGTYNENATGSATSPVLSVSKNIVIRGAGSEVTIIDGRTEVTVVYIRDDSRVRILGVSVINGGGTSQGRGIEIVDTSSLTLEDAIVSRNSHDGIRAWSSGDLTLSNVELNHNGENGLTSTTSLVITNSSILQNGGYGVISRGSIEILDSLVEENDWGGLLIEGSATLTNAIVTENGSGDLGNQEGISI